MKEEYISIRSTKEVKDYLMRTAKAQDRSLSSQIMNMLKQTDSQLATLLKPESDKKDKSSKPVSYTHLTLPTNREV